MSDVIDWDLQEAVWDEISTLENADRVPFGQNEVQAELIENFHGRVRAREFTFESDEPATMAGGENRGPRPLTVRSARRSPPRFSPVGLTAPPFASRGSRSLRSLRTARAPNRAPLEYFLAGFALCQQVIFAKNALATGIEIDSLSVEADGEVDPRGVLGAGDAPLGFVDDEISYTAHIESPATRDEVRQLVDLAARHCPAHASLRAPTSFDRKILLNGEPLDADR